jgi:hypothetical protein
VAGMIHGATRPKAIPPAPARPGLNGTSWSPPTTTWTRPPPSSKPTRPTWPRSLWNRSTDVSAPLPDSCKAFGKSHGSMASCWCSTRW